MCNLLKHHSCGIAPKQVHVYCTDKHKQKGQFHTWQATCACYAPINVKPNGGGVKHGAGILTFSLKKIKSLTPTPMTKKLVQIPTQGQVTLSLTFVGALLLC